MRRAALRQTPPPHGFTLVEVMVALAVFGLGLVLLAGVAAHSIRLVHRSRKDLAAAVILTDRLERLRATVIAAGCAEGSAGSVSLSAGRRESWIVTPGPGVAVLVDSVLPSPADSGAPAVIGATIPCP